VNRSGYIRRRGGVARAWELLRLGWAADGRAVGVLDVWICWERFLGWWQRIRPVRPQGVLRYSVARHRGRRVVLRDGTLVDTGDLVVELHLDNRRLVELARSRTKPWGLLRIGRGDLAALQRLLSTGELRQVKALHGVTLFATAGRRLGFESRPLRRSWYQALQRFFMAGLVMLYHPAGWEAVQHQGDRWPSEVCMSVTALDDRYGGAARSGERPAPAPFRED
jgi:hypothetical protein